MTIQRPNDDREVTINFSLAPARVIFEAEVPLLYTVAAPAGRELLVYLAETTAAGSWYILASCGKNTVTDMRNGKLTVREALTSSWMWLVYKKDDDGQVEAWAVDADDIPDEHLPVPGTLLFAETKVKGRRSVLQDWVHDLTFMQQSVLITSCRGPDGLSKDHIAKVLLRWLRRCFLISAFDRKAIWDPYTPGGGSFTGPCTMKIEEAVDDYLRSVDETPHHFHLHLMHAAEILGYKHPDAGIRFFWHQFYRRIVRDAHLYPESEEQMDKRLGDRREDWLAAEGE